MLIMGIIDRLSSIFSFWFLFALWLVLLLSVFPSSSPFFHSSTRNASSRIDCIDKDARHQRSRLQVQVRMVYRHETKRKLNHYRKLFNLNLLLIHHNYFISSCSVPPFTSWFFLRHFAAAFHCSAFRVFPSSLFPIRTLPADESIDI